MDLELELDVARIVRAEIQIDVFHAPTRQVASKITWTVPFREDELDPEEVTRVKTAICEFSDSPATFEWFEAQGYTLFERDLEGFPEYNLFPDSFRPRAPSQCSRAEYPFPHRNLYASDAEKEQSVLSSFGKIWYAQDRKNRHVAILLVREDSDELRIYELLRKQSLETLKGIYLLPVLDILFLAKHRFVVMPRWGTSPMLPQPGTLKEVTGFLHSMLKAVDFLHSKNIVHRDIAEKNVLVNHYSDNFQDPVRRELRSAGQLSYALIDFDIAIAFLPDAERSSCRLPSNKSYAGSWPQPDDVAEGDVDYDPFAFDIGCLGILFCHIIQHQTAELPFLAPFLDGMTTKKVSRRFTAREALQFFERHLEETPPEVLAQPYREIETVYYDEYDRWGAVPAELAERWAEYRGYYEDPGGLLVEDPSNTSSC